MFPPRIFNKLKYFINPFRNLFAEGFQKEGGAPAIADKLLKEDAFDLLLETGDHILLE